jgi:glucuronosyltransferase
MIEKYSQYGAIGSIDDIVERTVLWLSTHDLVIDYPRPSMPNIIQVGGLALKPAKPLSSHLLESITAWPAGFIVVSFGSGLSYLRPKHAVPLLEVFSKLDLLIIWRFENKDKHDIPKNVLLMNWLPQNDLLANENVKLFITHCGRSSLFEAIHYAVPMIGMPIFGDQPHNAKKMEAKGFGEVVDLMHIDSQDVYSKMNKVLNNDSYKNSIAKASRIFNSRREKPVERAVAGIEHILEFGGEHLRSVAFDLPWYQYWMVDIIALVLVGIHIMVYVTNKCIVFLFRKCCGQKKKEKQN